MFGLVDMRLTFSLCGKQFVLGARAFSPITYVQVRQNGMPKIKEMQVKLSWSVL